jgi:uncharacterized protein
MRHNNEGWPVFDTTIREPMRYLSVFALLMLSLPTAVMAVGDQLYQAAVEVANQDGQARSEGMSRAMREVLLKVSGSERVLQDNALQAALQDASRYTQRYQYSTVPIPEDEQRLDSAGRLPTTRLMLEVEFEARRIDALLAEHGYGVWGRVRPATLVWMGVEQNGKRILVGADDAGLVRQVLDRTARQRALPVMLPKLDSEDHARVQTADLWGGFYDDIQRASARYHAQAILVGRLYPISSQQWEVQWTLLQGDEMHRWQLRSADASTLIASGVEESAEWLSSRFAGSAQEASGDLRLHVEGVENLHSYRRLMDHLAGLNGVQSIRLESLQEDTINISMSVDSGRDALIRNIALGRLLEPTGPADARNLYYRLIQ